MPRALVLSTGYYTAAGAGNAAATPTAGDTFNVANFTSGSAYLEQLWAEGASTDWISVKSARMHDANQGIRLQTAANLIKGLLPLGTDQSIASGDTPVFTIDETGAATGAVAALYSYDDLSGTSPRLSAWADVQPRIKNISGVDITLGAIATIGEYSAGNAINANFDNFRAGADYALLGYVTAASVLAIAIQGQDTGNLKVGGPGIADPVITKDWFITLSEGSGRPCIPVIAANNKGGTLVYQVDNTAHAAQHVSLIMAELG